MKTINFFNRIKFLVLGTSILLTIGSCQKDDKDDNDDKSSDYVGVWTTTESVSTDQGSIDVKDVVNFSKSSFTEIASIKDPATGAWVDLVGRKGNIIAKDGSMDVSIKEAGMTNVDAEGNPTGVIKYYKAGTAEFDEVLTEMEMEKDYKALYTVSGNKLTIKADQNDNGSYEDEDEVHTFTKQ